MIFFYQLSPLYQDAKRLVELDPTSWLGHHRYVRLVYNGGDAIFLTGQERCFWQHTTTRRRWSVSREHFSATTATRLSARSWWIRADEKQGWTFDKLSKFCQQDLNLLLPGYWVLKRWKLIISIFQANSLGRFCFGHGHLITSVSSRLPQVTCVVIAIKSLIFQFAATDEAQL